MLPAASNGVGAIAKTPWAVRVSSAIPQPSLIRFPGSDTGNEAAVDPHDRAGDIGGRQARQEGDRGRILTWPAVAPYRDRRDALRRCLRRGLALPFGFRPVQKLHSLGADPA